MSFSLLKSVPFWFVAVPLLPLLLLGSLVCYDFVTVWTPEQVSEIVRGGIDVQLHTHRHRTPSDAALFKREIEDNRRELQAVGVKNAIFAGRGCSLSMR